MLDCFLIFLSDSVHLYFNKMPFITLRFNVMVAFPPLTEAKLSDTPDKGRPPVLHYKEDQIRDAFLERFPILYKLPVNLLQSDKVEKKRAADFPSLNTLVEKHKSFMKMQYDSEAAMGRTIGLVLSEMEDAKIKRSWARQLKNLRKEEQDLGYIDNETNESKADDVIDISELFKLSSKS